jgi:negative regulator of sigma E activity
MHEMIDQIDAYLDGELGQDEVSDLCDWIAADQANACVFARRVILHQEIRSVLHRKRIECLHDPQDILRELLVMEEQSPTAGLVDLTARQKQFRRRNISKTQPPRSYVQLAGDWVTPKVALYASMAACLVLAISIGIGLLLSDPGTPQTAETPTDQPDAFSPIAVATVTATQNAQWSSLDGTNFVAGSPLYPGQRLTLTAGFAEITTRRGAVVVLEAPATVGLIDSPNALRLHAGKLAGICEAESAKGFVVRTPRMDITDLGTRFGIEVHGNGETLTHVFEGSVEVSVEQLQDETIESRVVVAGQSLALDANGTRLEIGQGDIKQFAPAFAVHSGLRILGDLEWSPNLYRDSDSQQWPVGPEAVIFEEVPPTALANDTPVTFNRPGSYVAFNNPGAATIPRGTVVRTYVVLLNPDFQGGSAIVAKGSVKFNGQILGVTANAADDAGFRQAMPSEEIGILPSLNRVYWPETAGRDATTADRVELQDDGRTLSFELSSTTGVDLFRVIVLESAEDGPPRP